ncbi:hypothetical protein ASPCAL00619 [Aspergillus calidoustus]|uniref:Uncharacterized protein n=1 Tax=Aspergillus calidoustus TaxID=454130 RepID=A0A0U5FP27_ASPCI|nr:hypothetical protein ASPCAL00619 [Aspergillus calidoustus]
MVPIFVALYDNPGILHWSLHIETENDAEKTTIQILGARQRYFPDIKTPSNGRLLPDLIELCPLCDAGASKLEALKNIAYATPIRNEEADYSCQDYVLDVLLMRKMSSIRERKPLLLGGANHGVRIVCIGSRRA